MRDMALVVGASRLATVSPQVLTSIASGGQKTCRQSVRDALAKLVGWPVTSDWLSGAPQPGSMATADPHLYLETLRTASRLVAATLTHARMMRGDTRHYREVLNEEQEAGQSELTQAAVALSVRTVYPVLSWLSWRHALSTMPYRFPSEKVLEIESDDGSAWKPQEYREIIEASFTHAAGAAVRLLVDNGAAPLDPALLENVEAWVSKNLLVPPVQSDKILESETPEEPADDYERAEMEQLKLRTLAQYRLALEKGARLFSPGEDKTSVIERFVSERAEQLARFSTAQQLKAHLVAWTSSLDRPDSSILESLELGLSPGETTPAQPVEQSEPRSSSRQAAATRKRTKPR